MSKSQEKDPILLLEQWGKFHRVEQSLQFLEKF